MKELGKELVAFYDALELRFDQIWDYHKKLRSDHGALEARVAELEKLKCPPTGKGKLAHLIGKKCIRTKPAGVYGCRSFMDDPCIILDCSDHTVVIEFTTIGIAGNRTVLGSEYVDDAWVEWSPGLSFKVSHAKLDYKVCNFHPDKEYRITIDEIGWDTVATLIRIEGGLKDFEGCLIFCLNQEQAKCFEKCRIKRLKEYSPDFHPDRGYSYPINFKTNLEVILRNFSDETYRLRVPMENITMGQVQLRRCYRRMDPCKPSPSPDTSSLGIPVAPHVLRVGHPYSIYFSKIGLSVESILSRFCLEKGEWKALFPISESQLAVLCERTTGAYGICSGPMYKTSVLFEDGGGRFLSVPFSDLSDGYVILEDSRGP